ncbi:hypothetical protein EST38_g6422 [Candolleomyces aberdarensis]|uniref:Uncharacterized protein n=1 Tax=Candolleomyces aberdarensis TaxID=2316362 RepID=A0A4Q2DKN1_9AGAR|nr:hypothetical protein EST38_g6422 [Candolleomyces aberdarensis]
MHTPPSPATADPGTSATRYRATDIFAYHVLEEPVCPEESVTINGSPLFDAKDLERLKAKGVVWMVTSPNMPSIPTPPFGQREVRAREDGRYGLDDRMLHPQFVCKNFQWMSCPDDAPPIEGTVILTDVRTLKQEYLDELRKQQTESCALAFKSLARHPENTLLSSLATHTQQCLERPTFGLSLCELRNTIGDFQRSCLDIRAFVTYLDTFYPRHLSASPEDLLRIHPVNTTIMGGFTHSFTNVQLMHQIGIPAWWIRPSIHIRLQDVRVRSDALCKNTVVDERVTMKDFYELGSDIPAFQNVYVGPPGTRLQTQTQRLGCRVVNMVEPSRMAWSALHKQHLESNPPHPAQPVHLYSLPQFARLPNQPPSSLLGSQNAASQSLPRPNPVPALSGLGALSVGSDTFDPIPRSNEIRPPEIPIWERAVMDIKTAREREEERRKEEKKKTKTTKTSQAKNSRHQNASVAAPASGTLPLNSSLPGIKSTMYLGYRVPDPSIIMNAQGDNGVVYMATWLAQRSVHLYNLSGKGALLVKNITRQQWLHHLKGILGSIRPDSNTRLALPSDGDSDSAQAGPLVPSKRPHGGSQAGSAPASGKHRRHQGQTCGEYLDSLSLRKDKLDKILWYEQTITLGNEENLKQVLTPDIQAEVLWELWEINWRIELLALDQVLAANAWPAADGDADVGGRAQEARLRREMIIRRKSRTLIVG